MPEELWGWAWQQFNDAARSLPDCEHNRDWKAFMAECRKLQLAALRLEKKDEDEMTTMAETGRTPETGGRSRRRQLIQLVNAAGGMSSEHFRLHFNTRHSGSLSGVTELPEGYAFNVEQLYRSFHFRLHATRTAQELGHEHKPDDPIDSVAHAIRSLDENGNTGWYEIAMASGAFVSVDSEGKIRTRRRDSENVQRHRTAEDAAEWLLNAHDNQAPPIPPAARPKTRPPARTQAARTRTRR